MSNIAHNPCQYPVRFTKGRSIGFTSSQQPKEDLCGQESCRIGRDGKHYCELHYNQLPNTLKHKTENILQKKEELKPYKAIRPYG